MTHALAGELCLSTAQCVVHLHFPNGCGGIKAGCGQVSAIWGPAAAPDAAVMRLLKDGCTYPSVTGAVLLPDSDRLVSTAACYTVPCSKQLCLYHDS